MNRKNPSSQSPDNQSNMEAFHRLAAVSLSCAERLTALNLASTRAMLDDTLAASAQRPSKDISSGFNLPQLAFVQPGLEKAIAYSRSAYEILSESQQEMIQALSTQLTSMNTNFKLPTDWSAPFDMFTKGMRDIASISQQNASAATDATRSAVSETLSKLAKVG